MKTTPIIALGSNAIAIRDDATPAVIQGGLQSFADLNNLPMGVYDAKPYATYEPDFWLLDGNYKFLPDTGAQVGWMSTAMSGSNTNYAASVPQLRFTFADVHSTSGLTLHFLSAEDYADSITIEFYDASSVLIRTDTYTPTGATFATNQAVSDFKRIDIKINSANKASRYARLLSMEFDTVATFTGEQIKSARLVEQINPLALELPANTIEFSLFSTDGDFSIVNPAGIYANLQYKEPIDAWEQIGNQVVYLGRFYLDTWESLSENEATFNASDAIAALERFVYLGYFWAFNLSPDTLAPVVIAEILANTGIDYELDASLETLTVPGWINKGDCRYALQQFLIAIGAYATCARSNKIRIAPFELAEDLTAYDHTLTGADKGISSPITLRPMVTGIELTAHRYGSLGDNATVFSDTLDAGDHRVFWGLDVPAVINSITGGTDTTTTAEQTGTYADINVPTTGTVTIEITRYAHMQKVYSVHNNSLLAGTIKNVIQITDATTVMNHPLANLHNAETTAQRIYDYFQQRYLQKTKLFAYSVGVGNSVLIDVQSSKQLKGIVERVETNLTGGFVSDVEIVGVIAP